MSAVGNHDQRYPGWRSAMTAAMVSYQPYPGWRLATSWAAAGATDLGKHGKPMPLLEVRDLRLEYATDRGPLPAVDGVSLDLEERGQALGIIGESGSGKTSLAIALMRLLPRNATLTGGSMRLGGEDIGALSDEEFRRQVRWSRMAMVFQGAMHSLNPVIRVGEQVAERLRADGISKSAADARVADLLSRVGLPRGTASRYPHELSGGMKQRVSIARGLVQDPPVLLMDEPFAALDALTRDEMQRLLADVWRATRKTVIYVTHNVAEAVYLADRVVVMSPHPGTVKAEIKIELPRPRDPLSVEFLECQKELLRYLGHDANANEPVN